ncbi:MAG TPA: trehalose-phosphatase [Azoarcus sp.]|nr:trehalose-phosphatase [Azoarcus sp.]
MKPAQIEQLGAVENAALFFDVDGTLAPIAASPDGVVIDAAMLETLNTLAARLNGALAIITGRPLKQCDPLFTPRLFAMAAEHGAIIRNAQGSITGPLAHRIDVESMHHHAQRELGKTPGVLVEKKQAGIALHYRAAPIFKEKVYQTAKNISAQHTGIVILHGKMVVELKSGDVNKGAALQTLLAEPEFEGRRPIYFGDDVTDESAFAMAQALGGTGIKIGTEQSCAQLFLSKQSDLQPFLRQWHSSRD